MSYETSHPVVLQADQPFETLVVRVPRRLLGCDAEKIGNLTAVKRSGSERATQGDGRVPQSRRAQAGAGPSGAGGRCADGRARPRSHPQPVRGRSLGRRPEPVARGDPPQRRVVHRGQHRRSAPRSRGHRPRDVHLDEVPAQAVRRGGHERLQVDPLLATRGLPPRPGRSGASRRHDPDDRESLGPDRPSAFLPPVPQHVRLLTEGVQARNKDGGGDACHRGVRAPAC